MVVPADLREFYRNSGFCLIPLQSGSKRPMEKWRQYLQEGARKPDPMAMKDGTNYAVLCGKPSNHVVIFDFEHAEDARKFLSSFSVDLLKRTFAVETPHGGIHLYFRTAKLAGRKIRIFGEQHPVDFLGDGGYALVPPATVDHSKCEPTKEGCPHRGTTSYRVIGALALLDADDAHAALLNKGKELGWAVREEYEHRPEKEVTQNIAPPVTLTDEQIDAIVKLFQPVYRPGFRDAICMYLSGYLRLNGVSRAQAERIIRTLAENDPARGDVWKAVRTVQDTYAREGTIKGYMGLAEEVLPKMDDVDADRVLYTLGRVVGRPHGATSGGGSRIPECDEDHDNCEFVPITFLERPDVIVEQVKEGFVVWNRKDDTWKLARHFHSGEYIGKKVKKKGKGKEEETVEAEVVYVPLITPSLEMGQLVLAEEPEPCESLSAIIAEIEAKAQKWLYIGEEERIVFRVQLRLAVASWFLYVFEHVNIQERIAGLVADVGVSGGGKKRFLTVLKMVAYRPFYTLNTGKIPSIFRLLEPWGTATLLVDEADQKETGSEAEWIQFINGRFDGTPIPRYNANTQSMEIFRSFGFTALALRRMPKDEGTTSRMTKINATISPIELPEIAGEEIYEDFRHIRNKLLWLRLKYYGKLQLVTRSGLGVEQSWRGKETLTLYMLLAQIDPSIASDIQEIAAMLTAREVENLASTLDGQIINEIYSFIIDEDMKYVKRAQGIYFVQEREDEHGGKYVTPLTLTRLSEALSMYATEIERSLKQFKIGTYPRFRVITGKGGKGARVRGALQFSHLLDTDRVFQRYVPGYNHILAKIASEMAGGALESFGTPGDGGSTAVGAENGVQGVPGVPAVPPGTLRGGTFPSDSLSSSIYNMPTAKDKKMYNNVQREEIAPATYRGGTAGTPGTQGLQGTHGTGTPEAQKEGGGGAQNKSSESVPMTESAMPPQQGKSVALPPTDWDELVTGLMIDGYAEEIKPYLEEWGAREISELPAVVKLDILESVGGSPDLDDKISELMVNGHADEIKPYMERFEAKTPLDLPRGVKRFILGLFASPRSSSDKQ